MLCVYVYVYILVFLLCRIAEGRISPNSLHWTCIVNEVFTFPSSSAPVFLSIILLLDFSETEFICWHEPYFGPKLPLESQ